MHDCVKYNDMNFSSPGVKRIHWIAQQLNEDVKINWIEWNYGFVCSNTLFFKWRETFSRILTIFANRYWNMNEKMRRNIESVLNV